MQRDPKKIAEKESISPLKLFQSERTQGNQGSKECDRFTKKEIDVFHYKISDVLHIAVH